MFRRLLPLFFAIMALTLVGVSAHAKAKNEAGDSITANVKLTAETTVASTKIAPGEYKVIAEGGKAKFEQGSKVVAEVPCTVKDFQGKINQTTFIMDNGQLTEIQVAGKGKTIDF